MKYKSCVYWPEGCCPAIGNYSEDTHDTRAQAIAVIDLLWKNGFGGDGKFFPTMTSITEETKQILRSV